MMIVAGLNVSLPGPLSHRYRFHRFAYAHLANGDLSSVAREQVGQTFPIFRRKRGKGVQLAQIPAQFRKLFLHSRADRGIDNGGNVLGAQLAERLPDAHVVFVAEAIFIRLAVERLFMEGPAQFMAGTVGDVEVFNVRANGIDKIAPRPWQSLERAIRPAVGRNLQASGRVAHCLDHGVRRKTDHHRVHGVETMIVAALSFAMTKNRFETPNLAQRGGDRSTAREHALSSVDDPSAVKLRQVVAGNLTGTARIV